MGDCDGDYTDEAMAPNSSNYQRGRRHHDIMIEPLNANCDFMEYVPTKTVKLTNIPPDNPKSKVPIYNILHGNENYKLSASSLKELIMTLMLHLNTSEYLHTVELRVGGNILTENNFTAIDSSTDITLTMKERPTKWHKVCDVNRQSKTLFRVSGYAHLISEIKNKFNISTDIRIVLAKDGTEIVDNRYVEVVNEYTKFMFLKDNEEFFAKLPGLQPLKLVDNSPTNAVVELVWRIAQNSCVISSLNDEKLMLLTNMNVEVVQKTLIDNNCNYFAENKTFVKEIKDAASSTYYKSVEAKEAMDLLSYLKKYKDGLEGNNK